MIIEVLGESHLAQTLKRAATIRGFTVNPHEYGEHYGPDLTFVAEDVYEHNDAGLSAANGIANTAVIMASDDDKEVPVVVLSQVPPGWMRSYGETRENVFYQVDTIIMNSAIERMVHPEQIIVGCLEPSKPLPLAYQEYLLAFECPVLKMSYESAELAKLAINYFLTAQITTTNILAGVAEKIGADWNDVARALHNDKRIGKYAYLRPGKANQHLNRDVTTIRVLYDKWTTLREVTRDG